MTSNEIFSAGTIIKDRYEVIETLGYGGMGSVILAKDNNLEEELVAIKILFPELAEDKTLFSRFKNEVLLSRKVSHPNIVKIYDFGSFEQYSFITMEYVKGITLTKKIYSKDKLDFNSQILVILQICNALRLAHKLGVVHRDLKPDNIMLTDNLKVKIADFGLARSMDIDKKFTCTGETVGTPYYMSPEQLAGEVPDQRVDIYSLGIIIFEMLTSKRPFASENYLELAQMHMTKPIPDINSFTEIKFPSWIKSFIEKCTEKRKSKRFSNLDEVSAFIFDNVKENKYKEFLVPLSLY